MTAELDISHREDKKGLELILTQLTDPNGNSALVADIVAGNLSGGTAGNLAISGNLTVTGTSALTGNLSGGNASLSGTLAVTGVTTFTAQPVWPVTAPAAAGTVLGNATQLTAGTAFVTGANGTKGVALPATPTAGTMVTVVNTAAAVLKVYPDAAATINAIAANGPISMAANSAADFRASSTTQWYTIPTVPS